MPRHRRRQLTAAASFALGAALDDATLDLPLARVRRGALRGPARAACLAACLAACPAVAPAAGQTDGAPDAGFGDGGMVRPIQLFEERRLVALAPAGALLAAAGNRRWVPPPPDPPGEWNVWWWTLDPAGEPAAAACSGASSFPFSFAVSSHAEALLVDRAGRLLLAGSLEVGDGQDRALVARFDLGEPGCAPDGAFSGLGWEVYDDEEPCASTDCEVLALVEQTPPSGAVAATRYVALVRAATGGLGASRLFLLGLAGDGEPDPGFGGGDGWLEVDHAGFGLALFPDAALAVDPAGRLLVAVTHSDPGDALDLDVSLLRYLPGGGLDAAFGTAGRVGVVGTDAVDPVDYRVSDLALQDDGQIFVAYHGGSAPTPSVLWGRRPDGSLSVHSFGTAGPALLAVQGDRRLLAVRDTDSLVPDTFRASRFAVAAGSPWWDDDASWGGDGFVVYDVDLPTAEAADSVTALALWNGRPVYGGDLGNTGVYVLRAENRHLFADGFEGGTLAGW